MMATFCRQTCVVKLAEVFAGSLDRGSQDTKKREVVSHFFPDFYPDRISTRALDNQQTELFVPSPSITITGFEGADMCL